ncbi:glutaredoxin family protein [Mycobacteroides franklinii]|uniref:glutaredoxin family protein n=1 Tax=Mycobacteroides franklinii TaxID=948102 RepID=UPI00099354D7|nr:glutaredoxin family protein [Mycobacteroides franklinii]
MTPAILVYTKSDCPQCDATKRNLDRLHVPYRAVDVEADPAARDEVLALGYHAVPVVLLPNGRHWSGFRPDKIVALMVDTTA